MKHFGAFRATGALLFFPERGALTHHPEGGGGIACGNRALCEADAAPAGALCPMPHHICAAAIGHAVGYMFCFIIKTVVSVLETTRRLPA